MIPDPLQDQWDVDALVLREVVRLKQERPTSAVTVKEVEQAIPDLSRDRIQQAAARLARAAYVDTRGASGWACTHFLGVSERALRETGVWPDNERRAEQLLELIDQRASSAATPEERSRWERVRDSVTEGGRDFGIQLSAAIAARYMGA